MNWKQGLLRLWIVAALLWMVGSGTIVWDDLVQRTTKFEVTAPDQRHWLIVTYGDVSAVQVLEWAKKRPTEEVASLPQASFLEYNKPLPLLSRTRPFSILLLPPLAILLLGCVGYWVASGFRKGRAL